MDGCSHGAHRRDRHIGGRRPRPTPRHRPRHRHGPPALRPVGSGVDQNRVPAGRHPRPRRRRRAGRRRRRRRPSRLHHHGFAGGERAGQPGRDPQRVRGDRGGPAAQAARVHLIGRRLRLPLRQPGAHHRRRADPRLARALLLRAEGRLRSRRSPRSHPARRWRCSCCGRASSPGRRRLRSPKPCRGVSFPVRCATSPRRCRSSSRRSPIRALRCNSFTTTTSPPRSPWPQRRPRRLAHTTSPATGCCRCPMSVLRSAPGRYRCPDRGVSAASEVVARLPFVPSALEWLHVGPHVGGDGHDEGEVPAGLDAEIHRRRDVVGAGGVALATVCDRRCRRAARRRAALVGPVAATVVGLGRIADDVVVGTLAGPESDSAVSGFSLFTAAEYPPAWLSLSAAATQLVRPVIGHPPARAGDGLILGATVRRCAPDRRSTRWSGSSRTSPRPVRTSG